MKEKWLCWGRGGENPPFAGVDFFAGLFGIMKKISRKYL